MRQEELERVWRGLSAANLPEGSITSNNLSRNMDNRTKHLQCKSERRGDKARFEANIASELPSLPFPDPYGNVKNSRDRCTQNPTDISPVARPWYRGSDRTNPPSLAHSDN